MPADSEVPSGKPEAVWRPLGPRIAGYVAGGALAAAYVMLWLSFDQPTRDSVTVFQRTTAIAVALLGFFVLNALIRSRVEAHGEGLLVVNGYRRHWYPWGHIVAVRLPPGAPWATLDLSDGHTASVLAIQGSDGGRAKRAVHDIRGRLDG